jgi:hypothetical protein
VVLEGTVRNGVIVLDRPQDLPEGARIEVVVKPSAQSALQLTEMLMRHAGKAVGLPDDLAAQHDHYLHGTPKR